MSIEEVSPGRWRPAFWRTGGVFWDSSRATQWGKMRKPCVVCGGKSNFFWRELRVRGYRGKYFVWWTCAEHYVFRNPKYFLDTTRVTDGMFGINGEEIIFLQRGHKQNDKPSAEEQSVILDEMKRRRWTW